MPACFQVETAGIAICIWHGEVSCEYVCFSWRHDGDAQALSFLFNAKEGSTTHCFRLQQLELELFSRVCVKDLYRDLRDHGEQLFVLLGLQSSALEQFRHVFDGCGVTFVVSVNSFFQAHAGREDH